MNDLRNPHRWNHRNRPVAEYAGKRACDEEQFTPGEDDLMSYIGGQKKASKGPALTLALARKYAPIFDTPIATILAIAEIESGHNPTKVNMARSDKGGAWGLGQQMADEAQYKVDLIRRHYAKNFPQLRPVLARWKGRTQDLLDPELGMVLMAWQLGRLHRIFGDLPTVAAAYHQGENAVKRRLDAGQPAVSAMQPKGLAYVTEAQNAASKYLPTQLALAD